MRVFCFRTRFEQVQFNFKILFLNLWKQYARELIKFLWQIHLWFIKQLTVIVFKNIILKKEAIRFWQIIYLEGEGNYENNPRMPEIGDTDHDGPGEGGKREA